MDNRIDKARAMVEAPSRTLLLSMRRVEKTVAYCSCYEFEDVIAQVTGAQRIDVPDREALIRARRAYRITQYMTRSPLVARKLALKVPKIKLEHDYDFFFTVFNYLHEAYSLTTIPDWRERSRFAACFVCEAHAHSLPRDLMGFLSNFDHIFCGSRNAIDEIAKLTGRPCTWLPFASDVVTFAPAPDSPVRSIDVCNIGRRSKITHDALIELARAHSIFYYHDTVAESGAGGKQRTFRVEDPSEHRFLLASLLRRTKYFIANRSRANEPEMIKYGHEISGRFFEGTAAGAVLVGEAPQSADFEALFDWPDALIRVPFDAPDIGSTLAELDKDPERLQRIRSRNLHHAALRHDWTYRLRTVFETLGIAPTQGMLQRERRLESMASEAFEL